MNARDLSDLLELTTLKGPTGPEAVDAGAKVAEVIALGASVSELDPDAMRGVSFLFEQIRSEFTSAAFVTESPEAFLELWRQVHVPVLRMMDAIAVILHRAARASNSETMAPRLEHGDTVAINSIARTLEGHTESLTCDKLRRSASLVSAARACMREALLHDHELDVGLLKAFHAGVLIWALGAGLCAEIGERVSSLVDEPMRPGLVTDAVEFTSGGARWASYFAALSRGLQVRITDSPAELEPLLSNNDAVGFLLRAVEEVARVFGPDTSYALELFRYPDEPDQSEYHLVIDSPLPADQACERLDELCDGWWDEARKALEIEIFAVLGVIDGE